jgi:hypothetical protein
MNFVLRSTQLKTECGCSREYQIRTGPSQAMMKDLASATSSPPAEFTNDSYLMRNCLEFPKPLYFGRETGLNFGGHGAVCGPMDNCDSGSTNCGFHYPRRNFLSRLFCLVQSSGAVNLATMSCSIVLSFHLFLFELFRFLILLG